MFDRGTFVATFFTRTNPIDFFFFFFYPKITKLFAFLEYLSSRSLQGPDSLAILWAHRVGVEWLDARPPRFLPPCPHLPGQSPCNSCALQCRLGIVDRPRPPSIMSLMYVVFSPISPPCPFLFSLVSLTLSLSPLPSLVNALIRLACISSIPVSSPLVCYSLFFSLLRRCFTIFHVFPSHGFCANDVIESLKLKLLLSRRATAHRGGTILISLIHRENRILEF